MNERAGWVWYRHDWKTYSEFDTIRIWFINEHIKVNQNIDIITPVQCYQLKHTYGKSMTWLIVLIHRKNGIKTPVELLLTEKAKHIGIQNWMIRKVEDNFFVTVKSWK